ncbi:hypothetical protein P153DRAFT_228893 [Dothidotthia symphoricarpi CBS 119687]|uniref:Uncharacterized protein n=1 Tax=Dothidotthia symphoricarpi CBS 119687 TaxID=1392245 RepID=A0A6A6AEK6_9PLEO|nr:uncharacterized protein P153DRAFT_228893 [Dothidotthia symphoricarpi CBS 119687]KAF2129996.1 hypothetical protein P153DRAFT_228893 [Dothidotthia symphoricarpi CBS 119687]
MASSSDVNKAFTDGFNEAFELYRTNRLDECAAKARELLSDTAIPRYHRMKTFILLGSILANWDEANRCRILAEGQWHIVRRLHPEGADATVDGYMRELRESLDELGAVLQDDEDPFGFGVGSADDEVVDEQDASVEEARTEMEDLNIDIDAPTHSFTTVEAPEEAKMEVDKEP